MDPNAIQFATPAERSSGRPGARATQRSEVGRCFQSHSSEENNRRRAAEFSGQSATIPVRGRMVDPIAACSVTDTVQRLASQFRRRFLPERFHCCLFYNAKTQAFRGGVPGSRPFVCGTLISMRELLQPRVR